MIFQYSLQVQIQRILIGFKAIMKIILPSSSLKLVNALDRRLFLTSATAAAATTDGAAAFGAAFGVAALGLPMELRFVVTCWVADLNKLLSS